MSLKKMYNLLFFLLLLSGNLIAQTPCTEYPSPTIVPDFIAHCQDPKPRDQSRNDPQNDPHKECFVACENSDITYSTFNNPNNLYVWEVFGDANWSNSGTSSQLVNWNSPGAGLVQVTETTPDGCSTTVSICVEVVASPLADFTSIPQAVNDEITICAGGEVFFMDTSSDDVITWAWDFGLNEGTSNDPSPSHIYNDPGVYVVTLTVYNDCGCSDTKEVKVIVKPTSAPIIACISTICAGDKGTYSVTNACDGATFLWTAVGGSISDPTTNPVTVEWGYNASSVGLLTVEVIGCPNTCAIPTTAVIPLLTPSGYLSLNGPQVVCLGDITEYSIPPQPSTNYDWLLLSPPGNQFIFSPGDQDHSAEIEWNVAGGPFTICVTPKHTISEFKDCHGYDRICTEVWVRNPFSINGPDEICEGTAGGFSTTGVSADWLAIPQVGPSIPFGTNSSTSDNTNTLPAGIYQIVATSVGTPITCNPEAFAFLIVKPTAPLFNVSNLTGNLTVCPGSTQNYIATPDPGYFLTWSAQDGTVLGSGNEVAITWGPSGSNYEIYVTQEAMLPPSCPSTATISVNELIPNTPVIQSTPIGLTEVCTDGVATFSVPVDNDVTYYEWAIIPAYAGSVITGQNTESIDVQFNNTAPTATVIELTYVVCGVTQPVVTYALDVINAPAITLTIPAEACQNASPGTSLIADLQPGITGAVSWEWFVDGTSIATTSGSLNSSINYSFPTFGTQLITVEATIVGGSCPGVFTATQLINVKPAPVVNITSLASPTHCDGGIFDMVTLFASVQNAAGDPNGNYSYSWSPGGSTATQIDVFNTGTWTLTVLDNDTGCETSASINVGGCQPVPTCTGVDFTAVRDCNSFDFFGSLGNGYVFNPQWSFGDGTGPAFGNNASHIYEHSGYYNVTLTAANSNGDLCSQSHSVEVLFVPNFIAEFSCPSNQILVDLINQTDHLGFVEPDLTYQWVDATNAVISNVENPTGLNLSGFTQPITLNVTYTNSPLIFTCDVTETVNVPSPVVASFTAADNVCEGTPVQFVNTSTGGNIISATWDFDDNSGSNLIPSAQRTYAYDASGYFPSLMVEDEFGCVSTSTAVNPLIIHENTLDGNVTITGPATPSCPIVNLVANPSGQNYNWFQVNNGGNDIPFGSSQTSNSITTGEYYVIVSDALGCSAQSDNDEFIVIPPPTAFILGEQIYCHNETVSLSANQGSDYDYLWTVSPAAPINTTAAQISFAGNAPLTVTTYTVTVVVTNQATGCSNSTTITVDVNPNPTIDIPNNSPVCAPAVLTANASADVTSFSWSTGSNTSSTDVLGGGTVEVTGFTDAGCSASDTHVMGEGPDISDVAVGCYCFPVPTTWNAPAGYNYTYAWYEQGVGQVGSLQTYNIDHSGIYYVEVTDDNGCVSTSDPIIVDIGGICEKCEFRVHEIRWECVGIDENTGGTIYSFTAVVTNTYVSLAGLTGSSNQGIVGPITPNAIPGSGANTPISGTFILLPGYNSAIITFEGAGADGIHCEYKIEVEDFPNCGEPDPCDVDWKEPKVECIYSYQGWNYYSFSVEAINNGAQITDLVMYPCSSPYITITSNTSTLNPGSNLIEGYLRVRDGLSQDCIRICGFDTFHKKICCWEINLKFPDCKVQQPCKDIKIESKAMWCIAPNVDYQGNRVYYFNIQVSGPFVNGTASLIPYISQAENHVSDLSVTSFGNYYTLTGTIFDVPPSDDPLCFGIRLISPEGKVCFTKICMKVPFCLSESGPETRLVQDEDDLDISTDIVELQVSPNPASTMIMVDYNTKFEGNTSLKLTGLNGQVVRHYSNLFTSRLIPVDISTLEDGMYFLTIYEDGILKAQEKVVVLGD